MSVLPWRSAGLVVGPLCPFGTVCGVCLCNLLLQRFSFLYIQALYNDCSHIEDMHLLFCTHFMNISFIFRGVERDIFSVQMLR